MRQIQTETQTDCSLCKSAKPAEASSLPNTILAKHPLSTPNPSLRWPSFWCKGCCSANDWLRILTIYTKDCSTSSDCLHQGAFGWRTALSCQPSTPSSPTTVIYIYIGINIAVICGDWPRKGGPFMKTYENNPTPKKITQ